MTEKEANFLEVMKLAAKYEVAGDELLWSTDFDIAVVCNDIFYPAADAQEITPDNIEEFERALIDGDVDGPLLFCARVRKMRPRHEIYAYLKWYNHSLFDEVDK